MNAQSPTAAELARARAVLARHGLTALPAAELAALAEQAGAPADSLDRDLAALTGRMP